MKNSTLIIATLFIISSISLYNCDTEHNKSDLTLAQQDTVAMAKEAYLAGFPLVIMELTKNQFVNFSTPINTLTKNYQLVGPSDTSVVAPNVDNFYAVGFLDLSEGGLKLTMPSMMVYNPDSGKQVAKYFMMPMLDAYSNVFISPGKRTGFTNGGQYVIAGPGDKKIDEYKNDSSIDSVFQSPTNLVWILGRFQVDNSKDAIVVKRLMEQFTLEPYSKNKRTPTNPINDSISIPSPNQIVDTISIQAFFDIMRVASKGNPLSPTDSRLEKRLEALGISTTGFQINSYSEAVKSALEDIPNETIAWIKGKVSDGETKGWNVNLNSKMGNYGKDYSLRAIIAYEGFGANQIEDAVYYTEYYDSEQNKLQGQKSYTLTFPKDSLPPVDAFWSVTLYNNRGGLYPNKINRYAIGHDTDNPFHFRKDSSLVIYIQPEPPVDSLMNNWLPSPNTDETFNLMLRAYYPKDELLDGYWSPRLVHKRK